MLSAIKRILVPLLLLMSAIFPAVLISPDSGAYSNQYLFDEAVEIFFDTDAREENLDPENTRDIFKIMELQGDDNQGDRSQKLTVSLKKDSGANVKGTFYEPNGRPFSFLYSDGQWSDVEFFIPYDGDYFFEITTDPEGSSASYTFQFGGVQDIINSGNDGINKPGSTGLDGSLILGANLNPLSDPVDYYKFSIQPNRAVRAYLFAENPSNFEVLNETQDLLGTFEHNEVFEKRNDGGEEIVIHFRIYFPVEGGLQYSPVNNPSYTLNVTEWSHTTLPTVNTNDPWPGTLVINEDEEVDPPLNLSSHFIETGGDRVEFNVTSSNQYLKVKLVNITEGTGSKKKQYTHAHIIPDPNWHGEEVVSFKASDFDGSVSDSLTISVREVNDLPYVTRIGGADYTGGVFNMYAEEDSVKVYKMNYSDDDDPLNSLSFTTNASAEISEFFEINQNGTMVLNPIQDHVGNYFFNVTLNDGRGGSQIIDIALSIEPVNDPPIPGSIEILKGNMTLLPSEEIILEASGFFDPDGDQLVFEWDWGDGKSSTGRIGSHVYSTSHSGNTTITLIVNDGSVKIRENITVDVEAPEDIAKGDLVRNIDDERSDAVKVMEEWKLKGEGNRILTVSTVSPVGLDILGITTQRRESSLQILLEIKDTIQIDGTFRYHLFIVRSGYEEPGFDFKNITGWDDIPLRIPYEEEVLAHRSYLGDPSLNENSTGRILNKATLVWDIPFTELVEGGLRFPIDPEDFDIFAVSIHELEYAETGSLAERYIVTDTAGEGALEVDTIEPAGNTSGGSSSSFGDFAEPSNILVVIGIIIVLLIFGVAGFFLVQRQRKEKKREEKEFLEHIESMKKEGKDPFGKEIEDEDPTKKSSYEDLYGGPKPEGYKESSEGPVASTLPGPGLGGPVESSSHIEELEVKAKKPEKE